MSDYCPDCGCKVIGGHCTNCHEEVFIFQQDQENDEHVNFSHEFMAKVISQGKSIQTARRS